METLAYWVPRLEPLIRCEDDGEIIVVLANRTGGVEDDAVYAGTSAVLGIQSGEVKLYGVLGRGERELLVVDTSKRPQAKLVSDPSTQHAPEGQLDHWVEGPVCLVNIGTSPATHLSPKSFKAPLLH